MAGSGDQLLMNQMRSPPLLPEVTVTGASSCHSLALAIGICFGIYSSALVMASLVMWLGVSREDLVKPERKHGMAGDKILP